MAGTKISALTAGIVPIAADVFPTVQGAATVKVTTAQLAVGILTAATTGTIPTVGSGGAGTSALSIIAGSTNVAMRFQVTATGVLAGAVLGVVAFGGGPLANAPRVVLASLSGPTGGDLTPLVPITGVYTTSGFAVTAGNASSTATYIINLVCFF